MLTVKSLDYNSLFCLVAIKSAPILPPMWLRRVIWGDKSFPKTLGSLLLSIPSLTQLDVLPSAIPSALCSIAKTDPLLPHEQLCYRSLEGHNSVCPYIRPPVKTKQCTAYIVIPTNSNQSVVGGRRPCRLKIAHKPTVSKHWRKPIGRQDQAW